MWGVVVLVRVAMLVRPWGLYLYCFWGLVFMFYLSVWGAGGIAPAYGGGGGPAVGGP